MLDTAVKEGQLANAMLSCPDNTWPALPHTLALDLIAGMGFDAVDIAFSAGRSHIRPETVRGDVAYWGGVVHERLERRSLACGDVFAIPHPDRPRLAVNAPDPGEQDASRAFFRDSLEFARRIGSRGLTLRPGAIFGDETWERSVERSAKELRGRLETAVERGIELAVEPHLGSNVETPERVLALLDQAPGLKLRLDYSHFISQGISAERIEPLIPFARHFDCRFAAPGLLQARASENTIDYRRFVEQVSAAGFQGYLGVEFAWKEQNDLNRVDTIGEASTLAATLRALWVDVTRKRERDGD